MNSNAIKTTVMAVVFLALAGWYFGYEKNFKSKHKDSEEQTKQLTQLKSDEIQELEITRMKSPPEDFSHPPTTPFEFDSIKLKKTGDTWVITEPVSDMVSPSEISSMLSALTTAKQERIVTDKAESPEKYGLKPAVIRILAKKDSSDKGQEFLLGANTAVGFSAYAKMGHQDAVYKVARSFKNTFDKDAKALRNKNVVTVAQKDVTEIEIQTAKENVVLKKQDKEQWSLARDNMPADTSEVNKSLAAMVDLTAKNFVSDKPDDLKKYGLEKPTTKVWLKKGEEKNRTLVLLGKTKDAVYAKREDRAAIMEVDKGILEKIERPGAAYRSLALANFNRYDIKRVKIERKADAVELVKENGKWSLPSDPTKTVDESKVDALLASLQDTKVTKFNPEKAASLPIADPVLTVRLFEKGEAQDKERVTLLFAKANGEDTLGSRNDISFPFTLKTTALEKINLQKEAFIKKDEKAADTKLPPQKPS